MCGIAGIVGELDPVEARRQVVRMVSTLHQRGPDRSSVWSGDDACLACTRLSLVGGPGAAQPMATREGRHVLAYNGEVFNHAALRRRRSVRDRPFRTDGDTEVVLELLAAEGSTVLGQFEGQFAGALHDRGSGSLLLFRDRFGILPLYYAELPGGQLVFASTLRAVAQVSGVDITPDLTALRQVMAFWAPVAPETAVCGVKQLPPGHSAEFRNGALTVRPWTAPEQDPRPVPAGFHAQADAIRDALGSAVAARLRADHPVSVLVSGGVDSAVLAALAVRHAPVRSWSIEFDDPDHDESRHQREVVSALGLEHEAVRCTAAALGEVLPEVAVAAETPFLRLAPAATYLLGRAMRDAGVRAVLSGEGADEAFLGYEVFKEALITARRVSDPDLVLASGLGGTPAERRTPLASALMLGGSWLDPLLASHSVRWSAERNLADHLLGEHRADVPDPFDRLLDDLPPDFADWGILRRAQHLEVRTFLPGYLLSTQADRMLMAHSIEARYPYLDHELFAFASALPDEAKILPPEDKRVLRAVAATLLPGTIAHRPKQAYRAPVASVLNEAPARDIVDDLLSADRVKEFGVYDPARVAWLMARLRGSRPLSNTQEMALMLVLSTHLLYSGLRTRVPKRREPQ